MYGKALFRLFSHKRGNRFAYSADYDKRSCFLLCELLKKLR